MCVGMYIVGVPDAVRGEVASNKVDRGRHNRVCAPKEEARQVTRQTPNDEKKTMVSLYVDNRNHHYDHENGICYIEVL